MSDAQWLPLLQYSAKFGVSLSTLRRRIKNNSIAFKLEGGKYFLLDGSDEEESAPVSKPAASHKKVDYSKPNQPTSSSYVESSVLSSANKLVEEIKTAYAKILSEKEDQISQLKDEILDLRMLVRILEQQSPQQAPQSFVMTEPETTESIVSEDFVFSE